MKNARTLGKLGAGLAAVSLGLLGVGITATPAMAAGVEPTEYDITTSSVVWQYINESNGQVGDAQPFNSTTGIYGWTDDAFDSMPETFVISDGENSWNFLSDEVVRDINEGGKSTLVFTGHTGDTFPVNYTVTETVTLEGNYVRWAYVITGGDTSGLDVTYNADLGSDSDSVFFENGNTLVSNDSDEDNDGWRDPVVGFSVTTNGTFNGFDVEDGDGDLNPSASGASTFTLTSVVLDYNPASGQFATDFAKSLVPTLDATFGQTYPTQSVPLIVLDPTTLTKGVAVNTVLKGTVAEELVSGGYFRSPGFDGAPDQPRDIGAIFSNVPAGLTLSYSLDADFLPVFTLTGTPAESGTFTADITLYQKPSSEGEDRIAPEDAIGNSPISATAAITVPAVVTPAAPTTTAPAPKASLAATGFDGMILVGFGGLAAAAGILLVAATRRRRA